MDGFVQLFTDLATDAGMPAECIHRKGSLELPGFFRSIGWGSRQRQVLVFKPCLLALREAPLIPPVVPKEG